MRWKLTEYSGWGRVLRAKGELGRPERLAQLRALLREGGGPGLGNRRSYGDAPLNDGGRAIDMTRLDRLIAFDENSGVLTAEAGIRIGEILRLLGPRGWLPAVLPGTGFATLGGCIANDVHGKNHHVAGSFGQHVSEIRLMGASGRLRRVTPESNGTLLRATIGGLGQTGVIAEASIRLARCASPVMAVTERRAETLDEFMAMMEHSAATFSVGWIDATARGAALGRGILEEAEIAPDGAPRKPGHALRVPADAPSFFLSSPFVRLFNQAYYRRVPADGRHRLRPADDFFFPLDRVHDWNRLYGRPGFHQFQCVVPEANAAPVLHDMLERIAESRLASPLAVLKRLGEGRGGMMSFPMPGFTLAVDFPNRARAQVLIAQLQERAIRAGGRLYFAKDSLATPEMMAAGYDESGAYAEVVRRADPEGMFATDQVRRLKLRDAT